ncbi:MAG: DUF1015 domain-containing protein [Vicinamibacterales bacterium]
MALIYPFAALRPAPSAAANVAAVPYDVVTTDEARELATANPLSFLHVSRAEVDLPLDTDPYGDAVYARAAANLTTLRERAPLIVEDLPSFYVYRLHMENHRQTGVAACFSLDEYESDAIKKHEKTRPDKEDDRTRHMIAIAAQTGPVFLTYRDSAAVAAVVERIAVTEPLYDFTAPDGVRHVVWRAPAAENRAIQEAFVAIPTLYIADGHHRAASAARARRHLGARGAGEHDRVLAVAFPEGQMQILPYNRVVRELNGRDAGAFLAALSQQVLVSEGGSPTPTRRGEVAMYLAGTWYTLDLGEPLFGGDPTESLDVSRLQDAVLAPLLGIEDVRTDKRVDFVGGVRGTSELTRLVDSGRAAVAFSLAPVTVEDLMRIADAGGIMPPKSTWFEPKLRDGLLSHMI